MTLRVSPVRESAEMILLRPEKGRICLPNRPLRASVAGQYYDFVVDGEVADQARCVEGLPPSAAPPSMSANRSSTAIARARPRRTLSTQAAL
jgi:hypothetical protein